MVVVGDCDVVGVFSIGVEDFNICFFILLVDVRMRWLWMYF